VTASSTKKSDKQSGEQSRPAKERLDFPGRLVVFLAAVGVLVIGLGLLWEIYRGAPVAAPFTRVGGATHVETAVDASRFWLTPPQTVVETPDENVGGQIMLEAAQCAIAKKAPLLFTSHNKARQKLVTETIDAWHHGGTGAHPKYPRVKVIEKLGDVAGCLPNKRKAGKKADTNDLSTLRVAHPLVSLPGFQAQDTLATTVVFASAWEPGFAPDVAIGMALSAHMASPDHPVSLVVIPRYLEADRPLETKLESQRQIVASGVVLGQAVTVPDDTRALLRQLLTSTDKQGLLKQTEDSLGSVDPLVAALLALFGAAAAAQTGKKVIPELAGLMGRELKLELTGSGVVADATGRLISQMTEPTQNLLIRRGILKPKEISKVARSDTKESPTTIINWSVALPDHPRVIVWLRSGATATGILGTWYPDGAEQNKKDSGGTVMTLLRLNEAKLTIGEASPVSVEFLLIPVDDIALIAKDYLIQPGNPAPKAAPPAP
jgi:hypothetical protein